MLPGILQKYGNPTAVAAIEPVTYLRAKMNDFFILMFELLFIDWQFQFYGLSGKA